MNWFEAIILGLVQGLTEFLPISSSAHIRIFGQWLLGGDPGATFTAIIQIGTEAAVITYFAKDIWRIMKAWTLALFGKHDKQDIDVRMGWYVILGSIPIGVLGVLLQKLIKTELRSLWVVAFTLIVFGIILGLADVLSKRVKTTGDLSIKDGLIFGFAQALALIPGVSRSGGTITAGRLMGYKREEAARYSFLLAIPAVFLSGLYELYNAFTGDELSQTPWLATIIATIVSFIVGWVVIKWFLRYLSHGSFLPFVLYRIGLGTLIAVLLAFGVMSPTAGL